MSNWMGEWCQEKISKNENVNNINILGDNHIEIKCQNLKKYNVAVISESHITMDLIEEVIKDNTEFLFNIKNEPLIDGKVLAYGETKGFGIGGFGDIMRAINSKNLIEYQNPETMFIMNGLKQHTNVRNVIRLDNRRYNVIRMRLGQEIVFALNDYDLTAKKLEKEEENLLHLM